MCQNWLLMDENEIKCQRREVAGIARNWVVPRIITFVPVRLMTGTIFLFAPLAKGGCHETIFNTSKLYYGFPIFILGYQDQNFGDNITTCSSSLVWEIGWSSGVDAEENAADQIKHYQQFTVNIPDENLYAGDGAGWLYQPSGEVGSLGLDYEISESDPGSDFGGLSSRLDCQVDRIIEEDGICHIFAKILSDWLIQSS